MAAPHPQQLDYLADELTRRLGIPFYAAARAVVFRDRLHITDWAVPLIFDGHAENEDGGVAPLDFAAHALWPALRPYKGPRGRTWWYCNLSPNAAWAILDFLEDEDAYAHGDDGDDHDLLLDDIYDYLPAHAADRWVA